MPLSSELARLMRVVSTGSLTVRARRVNTRLHTLPNRLRWQLSGPSNRAPSMLFFTVHKAASTLIAETLLPGVKGLRHVDYGDQIYRGANVAVRFQDRGYLYGPLRATAPPGSAEHELLIRQAVQPDTLKRLPCTVLVRDPRDVLVSYYYSFGYSHPESQDAGIAAIQRQDRARIQSQSIDEFVLQRSPRIQRAFSLLTDITMESPSVRVVRYEDLVYDFEGFADALDGWITIAPSAARRLYRRSRPRSREDVSSHKRSGAWGGFRSKLRSETIAELNRVLASPLKDFGYGLERQDVVSQSG